MRLVHFTKEPLTTVRSYEQPDEWRLKPLGLWVSDEDCEDSWSTWCRGEEFALDSFVHAYEITLAETANILTISTAAEIDAFTAQYRQGESPYDFYNIGWTQVAADYQGMLITPYIWSKQLDMNSGWYYAWDCASGCIWDAAAIASVNAVEVSRP